MEWLWVVALALIILGADPRIALALWCVFVAAGTSVVLGYSIVSRRTPKEMAGRANTAINMIDPPPVVILWIRAE